jgi:single-strand DNA-binding protein
MAKDLNKVMLIGRLGKDPELKYMEKGDAYCTMTLATGSSYKDASGNDVERTEWHNVTAWRKLAEICSQYLKKGSKVYFEGRIRTSSSEKDGVKRYFTNIDLTDMIMLDSKGSGGGSQPSGMPEPQEPVRSKIDDDDLPF